METTKYLINLLFLLILLSCSEKKDIHYKLVKSDKTLSFSIDNETKNNPIYITPYTDINGKEYFTFQNFAPFSKSNDILIYDINTQKLLFKIKPEHEGANGVGQILGYHIQNLDSIYLTHLLNPK